MRKLLVRLWGFVRHILSVRGLLQWTGWWETVAAIIGSAALTVGSILSRLPWPLTVAVALGAFAAISVCWRVWRPRGLHKALPTSGPDQISLAMSGEFLVATVENRGPQATMWAEMSLQDNDIDQILDDVGVPRRRVSKRPLVWHHDAKHRCDVAAGGSAELRIARKLDEVLATPERPGGEPSVSWEAAFVDIKGEIPRTYLVHNSIVEVFLFSDPPLQSPRQIKLKLHEDGSVENLSDGRSLPASVHGGRFASQKMLTAEPERINPVGILAQPQRRLRPSEYVGIRKPWDPVEQRAREIETEWKEGLSSGLRRTMKQLTHAMAAAEIEAKLLSIQVARQSTGVRDGLLLRVTNNGLQSDFHARATLTTANYTSERIYLPWVGTNQPEMEIRPHDQEDLRLAWVTIRKKDSDDWSAHVEVEHISTGPNLALLVELDGREGVLGTFDIDIFCAAVENPFKVKVQIIVRPDAKGAELAMLK